MSEKVESRPRISVDKDSLIEVRAFADKQDFDRDVVFGYAIEELAKRLDAEDEDAVADDIRN